MRMYKDTDLWHVHVAKFNQSRLRIKAQLLPRLAHSQAAAKQKQRLLLLVIHYLPVREHYARSRFSTWSGIESSSLIWQGSAFQQGP